MTMPNHIVKDRKKGCQKLDPSSVNSKRLEEYFKTTFNNSYKLTEYIPILCKALLYINIEEVNKPMKIMGLNRTAGEIVSMFKCWHFYRPYDILIK